MPEQKILKKTQLDMVLAKVFRNFWEKCLKGYGFSHTSFNIILFC